MIDDDCKIIMEVHEQTTDIPLSLTNSISIPPHTIAVAVVECARPLNSTMDIRANERFLRDFPNICRAKTRPPRPWSTAECLCLIAHLRDEQASAASWEPRPPFEVAEMD